MYKNLVRKAEENVLTVFFWAGLDGLDAVGVGVLSSVGSLSVVVDSVAVSWGWAVGSVVSGL